MRRWAPVRKPEHMHRLALFSAILFMALTASCASIHSAPQRGFASQCKWFAVGTPADCPVELYDMRPEETAGGVKRIECSVRNVSKKRIVAMCARLILKSKNINGKEFIRGTNLLPSGCYNYAQAMINWHWRGFGPGETAEVHTPGGPEFEFTHEEISKYLVAFEVTGVLFEDRSCWPTSSDCHLVEDDY
jgi:hypothetical protein